MLLFSQKKVFLLLLILPVSAKIHLSLEVAAAHVTGKGFVSAVFPSVSDQIGTLTEYPGTNGAFVRLLS